jgi:hypothetical protein
VIESCSESSFTGAGTGETSDNGVKLSWSWCEISDIVGKNWVLEIAS